MVKMHGAIRKIKQTNYENYEKFIDIPRLRWDEKGE